MVSAIFVMILLRQQHTERCIDDAIFQHLLFDGLAAARAAFPVLGKTDVIVMGISRVRSPARSAHLVFAVAAYEFPGKDIIKDLLLAARSLLVFFIDGIHLFPYLLGNNGRENVVIILALVCDDARIALVVQDDIDILLIDVLAVLSPHIARFQIVRNGICLEALRVFAKDLPHRVGLRLIDNIFFIFDDVAERRDPPVALPLIQLSRSPRLTFWRKSSE